MAIKFGRWARLTVGGGMLGLGAWLVVPPLLNTISTDALVNAHIVVLRSPIEGKVETGLLPLGTAVAKGVTAISIVNDRVNASFSGELATERESLTRRIAALDGQTQALNAMLADLEQRASAYKNATRAKVAGRLAESEAALKGALARVTEVSFQARRYRSLADKGIVAGVRAKESDAVLRSVRAQADRLKAEVSRLRNEMASVSKNVFLGDGQNDVPYSRQRMDEVRLRLQDIAARRAEYVTRVDAINRQIGAEKSRLAHQSRFVQQSPIPGVVWRNFVAPGTDVVIGTELMEILDCSKLFLHVTLPERNFDTVRPGTVAEIRMVGSDRTLKGVVRSVRGAASLGEDRFLAAKVSGRKEGKIRVTVDLPRDNSANAANFCNVGRSAKVVFTGKTAAANLVEVANVGH